MSVPVFVAGAARQGTPVSTVTLAAASWRGTSMVQKAFATLKNQTFQGRGNGRFSLIDGKGPRIGALKGTIDTEFKMGSGAATVLLIQSNYNSTTAPLITLGVDSSGRAVGSIQDVAGVTVAAWTAASTGTLTQGRNCRMQVAWDSTTPIDGSHHVWVIVNGVRMEHADFTTAAFAAWTPFRPLYVTTGLFCETGFDGESLFTQATPDAPVLSPIIPRPTDVDPSSLTLPSPAVSFSGAVTPIVTLTGSLTLPSLQLSGTLSPSVQLTGTLTLPSLQLSGTLTVSTNKATAWLRLAGGTTSGGKYTAIPDILGANNISQPDTDRQPAAATTSNSLPILEWDGSDVLPWTLAASNNSSAAWGIALWIKPTNDVTTRQRIIKAGFPGAANKINFDINTGGGFEINWYLPNSTDGRQQTVATQLTPGAWHFIRLQFNGAGGTDAAAMKCFINEVEQSSTYANLGVGGSMTALATPSGTYTIGAREDQDAPTTAFLAGFQTGPNIFVFNAVLTAAEGAAYMAFETPVFAPTEVAAVTGWLRLANGTTVSGDYSSIPDALASNPAVQTVAAQRPTAGTSTNGFPTARFIAAEPNQLSWPVSANNNSTQKWGFACWLKMNSYPVQAYLFCFGGATGAYDNERVNLFFNSSRTIFFEVFGQDTNNYNGRIGQASFQSPTAGTWFFLRVQFDGTQATEALRIKIFINEVLATMTYANNGSGGNPVLLRTNAANIPGIIGNFSNTTDTSLSLDGTVGSNIFVFNDVPTAAQGAALRAYQLPT